MTFEAVLPWLLVTGGILCLGLGGSWLVDGASRIALKLGISPMVVGLTVVAFRVFVLVIVGLPSADERSGSRSCVIR